MSTPLRQRAACSVSVCGKLLRGGQSINVAESAIGDRERKMEKGGKISIRASNKKGTVQILCLLKGE